MHHRHLSAQIKSDDKKRARIAFLSLRCNKPRKSFTTSEKEGGAFPFFSHTICLPSPRCGVQNQKKEKRKEGYRPPRMNTIAAGGRRKRKKSRGKEKVSPLLPGDLPRES